MASPSGPWDLQEAITEQRTAARTATAPLMLYLDKTPAVSPASLPSSQPARPTRTRANKRPPPSPATGSQPASHSLRIVQGADVIKTIDITKLLAGDHEIRLVPPTRATILYSDPDHAPGSGASGAFSRLQSQTDSQDGSQGSQNKRNCFLKLCFHSLGDLKAASQAFLRLGLRCKTQFKTQNRSLSRTPSVPRTLGPSQPGPPPARSPYPEYGASNPVTPSQQYGHRSPAGNSLPPASEASFQGRSYSPRPLLAQTPPAFTRVNSSYHASTGTNNGLKRAHTEIAHGLEGHDEMRKHRQSAAARDELLPSQARRESSFVDPAASLWSSHLNRHDGRSQSRSQSTSPNVSRMNSVPRDRLPVPPEVPLSAQTTEKPPPRRELPPSIQRHMSQTPSQAGDETRTQPRLSRGPDAPMESAPTKKAEVAETEVQTEEPFVEPEIAFFAGMELFQDLASLKDQMLKECLDATRRLEEGGFVEEEARLIACYAIEFRTRFLETCSHKAGLFLQDASMGAV